MNKIRILKIISSIFRLTLIFSLSFVWMRYFFPDLTLSIISALFLTALIDFLLYTILRRRETKSSLKAKEIKEVEDMFIHLLMDKKPMAFFKRLASSRHKCENKKDYLLISEETSCVALFEKIRLQPLTPDDVIKTYKKINIKTQKIDKIVVICGSADKESYAVAEKLNINFLILNKEDTYKKLYKPYNIFPKQSDDLKPIKNETFKTLIAYSFNKKRTKAYFLSALVLLFSGVIIGMSIYYTIMASLLLTFAIVSYYNPMFNKKKIENVF